MYSLNTFVLYNAAVARRWLRICKRTVVEHELHKLTLVFLKDNIGLYNDYNKNMFALRNQKQADNLEAWRKVNIG